MGASSPQPDSTCSHGLPSQAGVGPQLEESFLLGSGKPPTSPLSGHPLGLGVGVGEQVLTSSANPGGRRQTPVDSSHLCLSYLPSPSLQKLPPRNWILEGAGAEITHVLFIFHHQDPRHEAAFAFYFLICLHLISYLVQRASGRKFQALIQSSENSLAWKEKHHPRMCQGLHPSRSKTGVGMRPLHSLAA